jgi:hypothetical protein
LSAANLEKLAEEPAPAPDKCQEEVTRLCPFPGCTLFVDHDGDHDLIPKATTPEEPPKPKRKPRAILPDQRKPTDPPPGVQP